MVLVGSEALSALQGRDDDDVFVEMMAAHNVEQALARKLFDALRNGLAHFWDTKFLDGGREKVELFISWEKHRHLTMSEGRLYLRGDHVGRLAERAHEVCGSARKQSGDRQGLVEPQITSLTDGPEIRQAWLRFETQRGEADGPTR